MTAIKDCIKSDAQRQEETEQKAQQDRKAAEKGKRRKWVVAGIVSSIVLIGNVLAFFLLSIPNAEIFPSRSDPMALAVAMNEAIGEYARNHGGRVPESLAQLSGKYLPVQTLSPGILMRYSYRKASDHEYELIFKSAGDQHLPDIRFTRGRIEPWQSR